MAPMISKATSEDYFYVDQELPQRLEELAAHDTRVLRKCLKRGIEAEYVHLDIPKWRRGDEEKILQMISAKESGFLVLPGKSKCVNPYKDQVKWDKIHAQNLARKSQNLSLIHI